VEVVAYDFEGRVLENVRRVVSDEAVSEVFESVGAGWEVTPFAVDWSGDAEGTAAQVLEATSTRTTAWSPLAATSSVDSSKSSFGPSRSRSHSSPIAARPRCASSNGLIR
jgi:hypothetical protein